MEKLFKALLFLAIGGLLIWGGTAIWGIPPKSEIRLFYVIKFGIIPIPIPFGIFATPKFWGGLCYLAGAISIIFGIMRIFNPETKTSPGIYNGKSKLTIAGIALIVASLSPFVANIFFDNPLLSFYTLANFLLLTTGLLLLGEKGIFPMERKGKIAIMALIAGLAIRSSGSIIGINLIIKTRPDITAWSTVFVAVYHLLIALFAVFILFAPQNKSLIRNMAVAVIVFSGLLLLWRIYHIVFDTKIMPVWFSLITLFIQPVAFIILASAFLTKDQKGKNNSGGKMQLE